jgi:hypothetical protein
MMCGRLAAAEQSRAERAEKEKIIFSRVFPSIVTAAPPLLFSSPLSFLFSFLAESPIGNLIFTSCNYSIKISLSSFGITAIPYQHVRNHSPHYQG